MGRAKDAQQTAEETAELQKLGADDFTPLLCAACGRVMTVFYHYSDNETDEAEVYCPACNTLVDHVPGKLVKVR